MGAGILNSGNVFCNNCSFTDNYAKNGGAIFNQGYLSLDNCIFAGNTAYGVGNHVCVGDGGNVVVNGKNITSNTDIIYFAKSLSTTGSVLIGAVSIIASFFSGVMFGALAGPVVGAGIGFLIGSIFGSFSSKYIISQHYDINYNRALTWVLVFGGSTLVGTIGGILGGCIFDKGPISQEEFHEDRISQKKLNEKRIKERELDKIHKLLIEEADKGSFDSSNLANWEHMISSDN